jgi:hypothetical protein
MLTLSHRLRLALALGTVALCVPPCPAQLPVPRLNSIFPCGARQGTTVECVIAGGSLDGTTALVFSQPGISAEFLANNTFKVTVAGDARLGTCDVRAVTPLGVSNFRSFTVGDWPEVLEKKPHNEPALAQRVTLPVVVNGRAAPTSIDHYVFAAHKGQRVFINCWAWRLDSQLDGTLMVLDSKGKELAYNGDYYGKDPFIDFTAPEDGDYIVKLWDFVYGGGNDSFYRLHISSLPHLDAALPVAVPIGGRTKVTFYGRNLPGGQPAPGGLQIQGRPLEVVTVDVEGPPEGEAALALRDGEAIRPPRAGLDGTDFRLSTASGSSNPLFLAYTRDPILVEHEPNNSLASAQRLPVPCDLSGTLSPVGDVDYYSFPAKKGEKLVIEVFAERQSGLLDPTLAGFDASGKRIYAIDDDNRNVGQIRFTSNSRDARWDFTAPADGDYFVQVRDLYFQQRGDPRFTYRLSIRRPRPDFRLVVVPVHDVQPDAMVVGRGGKHFMDVLAFRNDGFDEAIRVEVSGLPTGLKCSPVVIGPGKTSAPLVFEADATAPPTVACVRVVGKARIGDVEVERVARGGGLTWPTVNTPGIARLADGVYLAVRDTPAFALQALPDKLTAAPGDKLTIKVKVDRATDWSEAVQLSGYDLPNGATVALVTVPKGANEATVELVLPANLRPGTWTFTINGAGQVAGDYGRPPDPKRPKANNVRQVYPSNPIIITVGK